ncbi:MAG: hypothetical protein A3H57_00985 [Candidatus Taylorbacteria bacterium RIFCSPLOWO2_02_FULL_43_11]|uniref:Uncharacterized protein n=1 Tax=Candidatus Taylorbacteria bacterium RIFCSPHIGHO2_02_FULL_43_32b TaxID=1802306 RepID=A0A1G2MH35_9BACT|nr:MAG: hypothetical protein A2743_02900 [Candidatus Taylorbacteria bacterium RIFCSPHIGHO2_01_FULL_43_47]OHA23226.1 MAG: hypothetical protein A3C72_01865 [Candidatus Taylorbacteria bacterium RIFCSPHIGHO2_02_FULL_43_32b]OHA30066.1 MAG: hypothetical protein A3B08_00010 [Candidatus Taylorbacteria bacterium RIFCSPLOWO2_01_FULL_43_44]OHA35943.1 MAG: hypothetical protein A3H57_00985 [Candidatus Taylorbacteria bacterium RIFCSPLOWO2_02_FULL_43_11]
MVDVDFEESGDLQAGRGEPQTPNSKFVDLVLKTGVVKNAKQANYVLVILVLVVVLVALYLVL